MDYKLKRKLEDLKEDFKTNWKGYTFLIIEAVGCIAIGEKIGYDKSQKKIKEFLEQKEAYISLRM